MPSADASRGAYPPHVPYVDHLRMWADQLSDWLPETIFDAHVHLAPPEAMGTIPRERLNAALTTFTSFTWEQAQQWHASLFPGRAVEGLFAFGIPLREARVSEANQYIAALARAAAPVHALLMADPSDPRGAIDDWHAARRAGTRPVGFKPYFDFLGKSNYETSLGELLPESLLSFMDHERLILLLHTCGEGMGDPAVREEVCRVADRYPSVQIVLAHMGRYLRHEQFISFCGSGALQAHPRLYLEMSSASRPEAYEPVLEDPSIRSRLLFGTDLPFGLLTGVEHWSDDDGLLFLTRDRYPWSDVALDARFADFRAGLSYNTYHVIAALRAALARLRLGADEESALKTSIFSGNARRLLADVNAGLP